MTDILQKLDAVEEALKAIAKRPDLPNPERDADWKNCQKWSSHEAKDALALVPEIRAALEGMQWRPIETYDEEKYNNKAVLVWCAGNRCTYTATYELNGWMHFGGGYGKYLQHEPTHWIPIPTPPKGGSDAQ